VAQQKDGIGVKTKVSWHNKRWHHGENKSTVVVQTFFTPILKAQKQSTCEEK